MYLRRHRRTIDDIPYEYWTLVESRRTASGPRQHTVAMLGKLPGLDEQVHAGWEALDDLLEGRIPARQLEFGSKNTPPTPPLWREPYDSYDAVLSFIKAAAEDERVLSMEQTLYRTGGASQVVQALMAAAAQGSYGGGRAESALR